MAGGEQEQRRRGGDYGEDSGGGNCSCVIDGVKWAVLGRLTVGEKCFVNWMLMGSV